MPTLIVSLLLMLLPFVGLSFIETEEAFYPEVDSNPNLEEKLNDSITKMTESDKYFDEFLNTESYEDKNREKVTNYQLLRRVHLTRPLSPSLTPIPTKIHIPSPTITRLPILTITPTPPRVPEITPDPTAIPWPTDIILPSPIITKPIPPVITIGPKPTIYPMPIITLPPYPCDPMPIYMQDTQSDSMAKVIPCLDSQRQY